MSSSLVILPKVYKLKLTRTRTPNFVTKYHLKGYTPLGQMNMYNIIIQYTLLLATGRGTKFAARDTFCHTYVSIYDRWEN